MYNERRVAERIIEAAACALDYPRDRLQIQVLDDSTDESADLARRCCDALAGWGHDVQYIHRDDRRLQGRGAAGGMRDGHAASSSRSSTPTSCPPGTRFIRKT